MSRMTLTQFVLARKHDQADKDKVLVLDAALHGADPGMALAADEQLRRLASEHRDHPDYREDWKP